MIMTILLDFSNEVLFYPSINHSRDISYKAVSLYSQSITKGKKLFESSCISCHIANQKMVGPSPKGILERRLPEWIMNFIINPSEVLEKDSFAKELLKEFDDFSKTV